MIFTSGATESNSLALWGAVEGAMTEGEKPVRITRLFVSAIEHSSVLNAAQRVAERSAGVRLEMIPVTADGVVDIEALRVMLREGKGRTLVAVMAANNETGVVQPIAEISRLSARSRGAAAGRCGDGGRQDRSGFLAVRLHDPVGAQAGRSARLRRAGGA